MAVSDARVMGMMRAELKEAAKGHEKPACEECARLHVMLARERRERQDEERIKRIRMAYENRRLTQFIREAGLWDRYEQWVRDTVGKG